MVDRDGDHVYQPGLLFVPFGLASTRRITRPRWRQLRSGIVYCQASIDHVDIEHDRVHFGGARHSLDYDVLIVATGARLLPEETEGLTGPGWQNNVFTFYTPGGAEALRRALEEFDGGRLAVNVVDMPIKCPVAPLEFCFLAGDYFRRRGIRDRVDLIYVTPLDGAFTKPVASRELAGLLAARGIELVTQFSTGSVEASGQPGEEGRLVSYDERAVQDLPVLGEHHVGDLRQRHRGTGPASGGADRNTMLADPRARLGAGTAVLLLTAVAVRRDRVGPGEAAAFRAVNGLPGCLYRPAWTIMQLGAPAAVPAMAGAAWLAGDHALADRLLADGTSAWVLSNVIKRLVRRPRPAVLLPDARCRGREATGLGYLSGHTGMAVALGAAALPRLRPPGRVLILAAVPAIGLARIYIGAHLPLDVVGGAALGLAIEAASALARRPRRGFP